jgi:uncharacterized membrane protein
VSIDTLARGDDSRLVEPRRFVVRDAQSFAAVWSAHAGPDAIPPAVDFETKMAAAVFAGHRPTPGYVVSIAAARRLDDALVIVVEETAPDASQPIAQVMTSPYHVALLPRDDGPIRFDTEDAPGQSTIIFKPRGTPAPGRPGSDAKAAPRVKAQSSSARTGDASAAGESSTGLTPPVAAAMAYLGGPFSGALVLATERTSGFVRFHAWQAIIGLGLLGLGAVVALVAAFAFLVFSPTAFWVMLWLSASIAVAWVAAWGFCLFHAANGRVWKLPLAGNLAARRATSLRASESR